MVYVLMSKWYRQSSPEYFGARVQSGAFERTLAAHVDDIGEVDLPLQRADLVIAVVAQADVGDLHRKIPGIHARVPGSGIYRGKNTQSRHLN